MSITIRRSLFLSAVLVTTVSAAGPPASAQITPSVRRGMASALANGMSFDPLERTGDDLLFIKAPLDQQHAPPAWSTTLFQSGPNYALDVMFPGIDDVIEIDAHSTGNDVIPPLDENGIPIVSNRSSWLAITVSVDNFAQGLPQSNIRRRRNVTGPSRSSTGGDLITYYFYGSQGLDPTLVDSTLIEQPSEAMRFDDDEDIDAFDWGLGVNRHSPTASTIFFPRINEYFFSIAQSCVAAVNTGTANKFALDSLNNEVPANAATVYWMSWDAVNGWDQPREYRPAGHLGLVVGVDDLDALAVDLGMGTTVFSTQLVTGRSQLQVHDYSRGVFPLRNELNMRTTTSAGSRDETDNINAACVIDPEAGVFDTVMGVPTSRLGIAPTSTMGISVTPEPDGPSSSDVVGVEPSALLIQTTGWGAADATAASVTFAVCYDYNRNAPWPYGNWNVVGTVARDALEDVTEFAYTIPQAASGLEIAVSALLSDAVSGSVLAESWVSELRVP